MSLSCSSSFIIHGDFHKNLVNSTLQVGDNNIDVTQLRASTNAKSNRICCNVIRDATCEQDWRHPAKKIHDTITTEQLCNVISVSLRCCNKYLFTFLLFKIYYCIYFLT